MTAQQLTLTNSENNTMWSTVEIFISITATIAKAGSYNWARVSEPGLSCDVLIGRTPSTFLFYALRQMFPDSPRLLHKNDQNVGWSFPLSLVLLSTFSSWIAFFLELVNMDFDDWSSFSMEMLKCWDFICCLVFWKGGWLISKNNYESVAAVLVLSDKETHKCQQSVLHLSLTM